METLLDMLVATRVILYAGLFAMNIAIYKSMRNHSSEKRDYSYLVPELTDIILYSGLYFFLTVFVAALSFPDVKHVIPEYTTILRVARALTTIPVIILTYTSAKLLYCLRRQVDC